MELTEKQLSEARDWIKDCIWGDLDQDDVDDLSNEQIIKGIQDNYNGGLKQFVLDSKD